jgi:PleD family two-component response regulator
MPSPDEAPELRVTVSAGVAPMLRAGKAPMLEHALRAADRALYRAKREGRDRVIPASPISPENTLETP